VSRAQALGYGSWRECVTAEFHQAQTTLYQQLDAARMEMAISANAEIGSIPEGQLRPLAPLRDKPEEVKAAWSRANERTEGPGASWRHGMGIIPMRRGLEGIG
jgi:hypothetical protein